MIPTTPYTTREGISLPQAPVMIVSGGVVPGPAYDIPATYPQQFYQVDVAPYIESSLLSLSIVPLQYFRDARRVELYDRMIFEITVTRNPSTPGSLAATTNGNLSSGGEGEKLNNITFDPQSDEIHVTLPEGQHGQAVLAWSVLDGSNRTLLSQRTPVNLDTYSNTLTLTLPVDSKDWPPRDQLSLRVFLQRCDGSNVIPPEIESNTAPKQCRPELFQFSNESSDAEQSYQGQDAVATWRIRIRDGCEKPIDPQEFKVGMWMNGNQLAEGTYTVKPEDEDEGLYTIELPLGNLSELENGANNVKVVGEYNDRTSFFETTMMYESGSPGDDQVKLNDLGHTFSQGNNGVMNMHWYLGVYDQEGVFDDSLSESNFEFYVGGERLTPERFDPASTRYTFTLLLDKNSMGETPTVVAVVNKNELSDTLSRQVTIPNTPPEVIFLSVITVAR